MLKRTWRSRIKHVIPPTWLNATLLRCPFLYDTQLVNYETNLAEDHGIEDLLDQLRMAIPIRGDIIECGSSRCGGSVLMGRALRQAGVSKTIFACDSFEGFDREELRVERALGRTDVDALAFTSTSFEYVCRKLRVLGLADLVKPVRGYFVETLPGLVGPWCFALVDCDLMQSLIYCGEQVWARLVPGGRIVFDDYTSAYFAGARRGIDEFVQRHAGEISEHGLLNRLYYVVKRDGRPHRWAPALAPQIAGRLNRCGSSVCARFEDRMCSARAFSEPQLDTGSMAEPSANGTRPMTRVDSGWTLSKSWSDSTT
jgi:O-methyltransferase